MNTETTSTADLRAQMQRLGPWHLEVEITPELSTRDSLDVPAGSSSSCDKLTFESPHKGFSRRLLRIFPNGLEGRSVLDCACNCGAFLFWAKELGAGRCFGFDVREHWINQARFLAEHRVEPSDDVHFEICDLYDLPKLGLEPFDLVFFRGIFYHLPDPITGLKVAADLTNEVLILNTATRSNMPDGLLAISDESRTHVMSGVYGLNWFPTGPRVLEQALAWTGLHETRRVVWRTPGGQPEPLDRLEILAARDEGFLEAFDASRPEGDDGIREVVHTNVPPRALVLVATRGGDEPLDLRDRQVWRFPRDEQLGEAGEIPDDGRAIEHLEQLRFEGAQYLVFAGGALAWLERNPELAQHARDRYATLVRDETCVIFDLHRDSES